jgi:hypothetical protein
MGEQVRFAERAFGIDGAEDTTLLYEFSKRRIS